MNVLRFITLIVCAVPLVSCGDLQAPSGRDDGYTAMVPRWSADAVDIKCPTRDCPEGVGALIFVQNTSEGYRLQRCTGTLIAPEKILTNSHCGKLLRYDRAYFFLPQNGRIMRYALSSRIFDREDGAGIEAGMGPDLAIFQLVDAVKGVKPRSIARRIPDNLKELISYKIDEPGAPLFEKFVLNKDICTTIPRQALFGGGSEEMNIGLALFGCKIVHGNSGSPLFAAGDLENIQVVVNTSYPFQNPSTFSSRLEALFSMRPVFFSENFAMGNRVHCMEIQGVEGPQALCARATVDDQIRRAFQASSVKIARERLDQLNTDPAAVWGLRVFKTKVKAGARDPYPKSGMVLVPYPVCVRSFAARGELGPQEVQYLTLDMSAAGDVSGQLQKSQVLRARFSRSWTTDKYQILFERDYRVGADSADLAEPDAIDAQATLSQSMTQVGRCRGGDRAEIQDDDPTVVPELLNSSSELFRPLNSVPEA